MLEGKTYIMVTYDPDFQKILDEGNYLYVILQDKKARYGNESYIFMTSTQTSVNSIDATREQSVDLLLSS